MTIPLVVGLDGSEASLEAVDWAADEAVLHQVPLRLLHAAATRLGWGAPRGLRLRRSWTWRQ
ncbi:universal stress protein, partial [Streptomyces sp. NPDC001348]